MSYPHHDYIEAVAAALTTLGVTVDHHHADSADDCSLEAAIDLADEELADRWRRRGGTVSLAWAAPGPESNLNWGWAIVHHGRQVWPLDELDNLVVYAAPAAVAAVAARRMAGRDVLVPSQEWPGADPLERAVDAWLAEHNDT